MNELEIIRKDMAPVQFKVLGILIVLATNYKVLTFTFYEVNPWIFIIGNAVAFAVFTAKDILIIDFKNKQIREGFKVYGLRSTDKTAFSGLEKIFINKIKTSRNFNQMTRSMTIYDEHYKAFLKTFEGDKYWVAENSDKDKLINRLRSLNEELKVEIYDTSGSTPERIG